MLIPEVFGRPGKATELISFGTVATEHNSQHAVSPLLRKLCEPSGNKVKCHPDDSTGLTRAYRYSKRAYVKSMPPCLGALAHRQRSWQLFQIHFGSEKLPFWCVSVSFGGAGISHHEAFACRDLCSTWHVMLWVPEST